MRRSSALTMAPGSLAGARARVLGARARVLAGVAGVAFVALLATAVPAHGRDKDGDAQSVVDDWGRVVQWQRRPQRIVSLAPHATELLFSAGAGPRVVAVDDHSDHPRSVRRLTRISSYPAPDREALLALRPDLVVLWGAAADRSQIARLETLGLTVFVSEPRGLDAIAHTLERFGRLGGEPTRGARAAQRLRERIASLRARYQRSAQVPVFVQAWARPLLTLSDRDTIGDALRVCGARNLFGDMAAAAPRVGVEAVLAASPRLIVAIDAQADRSLWESLGILAPKGTVEFAAVDATIQRPSDRIVTAIEQLCAAVDQARRR